MEISNKQQAAVHVVRSQFEKLGTDIDIRIIADDVAEKKAAEKDLLEIERLYAHFTNIFSRFDPTSELSKLNSQLGKYSTASFDMLEVVALCLDYYAKTDGLYDPRILDVLEKVGYADDFKDGVRKFRAGSVVENDHFSKRSLAEDLKIVPRISLGQKNDTVFFGTRMDFSGIAKGYITDKVVEFLKKRQWKNFLVDSGGDMFMRGVDEDGKLWTVNVEGIDEKKLIFTLDDKAVATSGIGRRKWEIEGQRMHHIINPRKPQEFCFDLKSVSIIAESTTAADVWAKTIFLMGREGGMLYAREHDIAAVILDCRGSAWISPKAKEFLY